MAAVRENKPYIVTQTVDLDSPEFIELIRAAGNACLGLGPAIDGLAKGGHLVEAKELTAQLLHTSKSISWTLKVALEGRINGR